MADAWSVPFYKEACFFVFLYVYVFSLTLWKAWLACGHLKTVDYTVSLYKLSINPHTLPVFKVNI